MKKILSILCCLYLVDAWSQAQLPFNLASHQELSTVFTNDNSFIPGERILFRMEVKLPDASFSFISKVGYIELINKERKSVVKQKIKIVDGIGQGHLYLPSFLETGNYTLIAYTAWMLNYSRSFIPQVSIEIINPFRSIPSYFSSDSLGMQFYPEGNAFVENQMNRVSFFIDRPVKNGSKVISIRVLSPGGNEILNEKVALHAPYGHFNFQPTTTGEYRVIVTDENEAVHYFPLDIPNLGKLGIAVKDTIDRYLVRAVNHTGTSWPLVFVSKMNPTKSQVIEISKDSTVTILKKEWPAGITWIQYDGTEVYRLLNNIKESDKFSLAAEKTNSNTREKLTVKFDNENEPVKQVSISVRKKYESIPWKIEEARNNDRLIIESHAFLKQVRNELILPEYRGQILSGKLSQSVASNQSIYLASIDEFPILLSSRIAADGRFHFMLPSVHSQSELIIFSPNEETVEVNDNFLGEHDFVHVSTHMMRRDLSWLESKAIDVQIEDAYYPFRQDIELDSFTTSFFKGKVEKQYNLDAYTRFPTMAETILEVVPDLRVRDNVLIMPYARNKSGSIDSTLVLVDGVPATVRTFLDLDPTRIKNINILPQQVKLGHAEGRGVTLLDSFAGDASILLGRPGYAMLNFQPVQSRVKYFQPDYNENSTMADHRIQLFWDPAFQTNSHKCFEFYTSDLTGEFEIVIRGISDNGESIYEKSGFVVVDPTNN